MTGFDTPPVGRATFWHDTTPWLAGDQRGLPKAESQRASPGVLKFVHLASRLDSTAWAVLSEAANQPLNHSPAAFDIFTGLYWPLRNKDQTLPSRNAAWLALKVMATAGQLRPSSRNFRGPYEPWCEITLRDSPAKTRFYPRSVPVGRALEVELRALIRRHAQKSSPTMVDWPGLCQFIHNYNP